MLQILKHGYSSNLDFILLFVGILSLYAINLSVVSLFAYLPLYVFSDVDHVIVSDEFYQFEGINIVLFL